MRDRTSWVKLLGWQAWSLFFKEVMAIRSGGKEQKCVRYGTREIRKRTLLKQTKKLLMGKTKNQNQLLVKLSYLPNVFSL